MKPAVLCIDRRALSEQEIPTIGYDILPFDITKVPSDAFSFINRKVVDTTESQTLDALLAPAFPQILGYIVIKHGDKYLSYARKYSGEARLLGARSIGFGGHVDLADYGFTAVQTGDEPSMVQVLQFSIERELFEELELESLDETSIEFKGLIVDTTNDVGKVHRGLLCVIELDDPSDVSSTKETQDLKWFTLNELKEDLELYENWSKLAINSQLIHGV